MTKSMGINIAGFVVLAFLLWKISSDMKAYQQQVATSLCTEQIADSLGAGVERAGTR